MEIDILDFDTATITSFLGMSNSVTIVLFGASGDLAKKKIIPAIHSLLCEGVLDPVVIGTARTPMSDEDFQSLVSDAVNDYARLKAGATDSCKNFNDIASKFRYLKVDSYDDLSGFKKIAAAVNSIGSQNVISYLSVPPQSYRLIAETLAKAGLNSPHCKLLLEKPFGLNENDAFDLNQFIQGFFDESQIYRIDHYAARPSVMNLLAFRFFNSIYEPLWNRNHIKHIVITMEEKGLVGKRTKYYEQSGVIRDMVQNHLLQVLAFVTMECPVSMSADDIRDEKQKVLKCVQHPSCQNGGCVLLGQYKGYRQEPDVKEDSITATAACLTVFINNWRWKGVPITIQTCKGGDKDLNIVEVFFDKSPLSSKSCSYRVHTSSCPSNKLTIHLKPENKIEMSIFALTASLSEKSAQDDTVIAEKTMVVDVFEGKSTPDPYEKLIIDAARSDQTLFARSDEVQQAWRIVDSIITAHEKQKIDPIPYQIGLDLTHSVASSHYAQSRRSVIRRVHSSQAELANAGALVFSRAAHSAFLQGRDFNAILSGGDTPKSTYRRIAESCKDLDWNKIHIWMADERYVGSDSNSSNFKMITESLLDHVSIPEANVHRMRTDIPLIKAIEEYNALVAQVEQFDLAFLGLGTDGHTMSLFPGAPTVVNTEQFCVDGSAINVDHPRLSLTFRVLLKTRLLAFLVTGARKKLRVNQVLNGPLQPSLLPAQLALLTERSQDEVVFLMDEDAAVL
ncbi:hypothetical protein P9112_006542 [Eukaryota sp. TZLM1-RC]